MGEVEVMNTLSLTQAAEDVQGILSGADVSFSAVSTDTRSIKPDDLFVALKGPNFDGHRFIPQAMEKGAVAVMVSEPIEE